MKLCLPVLAVIAVFALGPPVASGHEVPNANTIERYRAALEEHGGLPSASLPVAGEEPAADKTMTSPESSASAPLVVDGPPTIECPNAAFVSIQAAVTAAPAGSTIKVCPGLYTENVVVPKQLTLTALRPRRRATPCPLDLADDPTRYAIVDPPGFRNAFRLGGADGIVLEGFVAQGDGTAISTGIATDPAFSGYEIRHTISQSYGIGIAFGSSGALESAVERSCIRGSRVAGLSSLGSAEVEGNELTGNGFGMALVTSADVDVTDNDVSDSSLFGIFVSLGTNVSVRHNRVARSGSAIVYDSSSGDIGFNLIEQAADTGISLLYAHDVLVRSNHLRESGVGLHLLEASGNTLLRNRVERSLGDGIVLDASNENALDGNLSRDNGANGLRITSQSSGNTIRWNTLLGNDAHDAARDCYDDTFGAATAGTANFWMRNIGKTENRLRLCSSRGPAWSRRSNRG